MLLGGRYELLRAIASGGMATVHLARAVGVGGFERLVAIKVMHPHIAAESEFVAMFLDEARLAAQIRHPNVVATIDVQEAEDGLFLVMEFVDGPSLKTLRKQNKNDFRLPHPVLLRVMIDTLNGLHAAHDLRGEDGERLALIHRDVSPANILIGVDGIARITDFGVARAETRLSSTRGGKLKGKLPYMPPEQILAEPMDHRCDIYAAGVVLWEQLVGRRLFKADSDGALLQAILDGPTYTPSQIHASIPQALDRACMLALHRDASDRYATAADMAEALETAAHDSGIRIASTRQVAELVEASGVHDKLDAKKLAALKRASKSGAERMPMSSSPGSWPSGPSGVSGIEPKPPSIPSSTSNVTAGAQTISAAHTPSSSTRTAVLVGGAIAVLGLVGGVFIATSSDAPSESVAPAAQSVAAPTPPPTETSTPEPSATAPPAPSVTASATAEPSATAAPSVTPPSVTPPSFPRSAPVPRKTSPQPPSGSYNPERL